MPSNLAASARTNTACVHSLTAAPSYFGPRITEAGVGATLRM
jgi:hypothetical protein